MTVLVVGGGISGLAAAHALGRDGVPTLLLESGGRLGGKVRTERVGDFLVEVGPDSFVSYKPAGIELCRELGLGDALIGPSEPRTVLVRARGRLTRLPDGIGLVLPRRLGPFITTPLFSPLEKLRMGLDLVLPRGRLEGDMAVGPFLRRRLGRALVDRLAGPLIGGLYGTPIDELSLDAVVPQLRAAERDHRSLLLASVVEGRAATRGPGQRLPPFVSLSGGLSQLIDALVTAIGASPSVQVRLGVPVRTIERRDRGLVAVLASGERVAADAIVLASPAPVSAMLLEGVAPAASRHLRTIPHGPMGIVTLGYRAEQFATPPAHHGFLVAADEPLSIRACTVSSVKWPARAPEGTVLLRAFMRLERGHLNAATDDELALLAERDLAATLGARGRPILVRVDRQRAAMPHYVVGHHGRVVAAEAELGGVPNLVLAGGAYRGVGLPDCIAQGRAAAVRVGRILEGADPRDGPPGRVLSS